MQRPSQQEHHILDIKILDDKRKKTKSNTHDLRSPPCAKQP